MGIVLSWEKVALSLGQPGGYEVAEKEELFHWKPWALCRGFKKPTHWCPGEQTAGEQIFKGIQCQLVGPSITARLNPYQAGAKGSTDIVQVFFFFWFP